MKEKIDLLHFISKPLSARYLWYKNMTTYHEKEVHPIVKLANGLAIVSLAVATACNTQESPIYRPTDPPRDIPTQPAPGELGEIIENPTVSAENALQRQMGILAEASPFALESVVNQHPELKDKDVSVFSIKIAQNQFEFATTADVKTEESWAVFTGNTVIQGDQINADQMTIQNEKLFLKDNAGIWKELIKIRIKGQNGLPDVFAWYLFDQKPNSNGTIDLSLTKSVLAYPALSEEEWIEQTSGPIKDKPVMIMWAPWQPMYIYPRWETDYVVIPINGYENIPGGAKDALVVSQKSQISATPEPTSTPEVMTLPNLGNPRYGEVIEKLGKDRYQVTETQILVDWDGTGNFELAFEKVGDKWELEKFWAPAPEGWDKVSVEDIIGKGPNGNAFLFRSQSQDYHLRAKTTGRVRIETRKDFVTGEELPGYMVIVEAVSRKEPGTPKFTFEYVAHADDGNGIDMMHGGENELKSIFEYAIIYTPDTRIGISIPVKNLGVNWKPYSWLIPNISNNQSFIDNSYARKYLIIPTGYSSW